MKKIKNKRNVKTLTLFYILMLLFSVSFLATFSFDSTSKEQLLNNAVFDYSESSSKSDFSYCMKINKFSDELPMTANRLNRIFYNNRNVVSVIENSNYSLYGKGVAFSNSSKLDTAEGFTTNHLLFSSSGSKKIVDLDYFEGTDDETIARFNIIIPYSLSIKIANEEMCSFDELLYTDVSEYFKPSDFKYYVAGIWDDQIASMSYYNYNSFYSEFNEYVIFINNKYTFSNNNTSVYLLVGNNRTKNLDFFHSCKNSNGGSLEFDIPKMKINDFYINHMLFHDYYNYLIGHYKSLQTIFVSCISGVLFIFSFVAIILILIRHKTDFYNNRLFLLTSFFTPIISAILSSIIVVYVSRIKINTLPIISVSSIGMLLLCVVSLAFSAVFYFVFSKSQSKASLINKKLCLSNKVAIFSFCDLGVINASTVRINNIIKMLEIVGKQWIHIGYFESRNSSDNNIGIKIFNNKFLNFIFAPFLFIQSFKKIKNQINVAYIYSPLPVFSSIFINFFANHNQIKVVHDVCEFQNISEVNFKKPGWFYISNVFYNRFIISYNDKVIPITTYLEKYFKSKGAKTFLVPPVFDERDIKPITKKSSKEIVFAYIGFPGKKDNLKMCIDGFRLFMLSHNELIQNITIAFYGPLEQYFGYVNGFAEQEIKERFVFYGKCSRTELQQIYEQTSFVFFMRNPKKRFSKAGFPSKVVESLFYSTPILTNKTSDLDLYLHEPNNVIWVNDYSSESFCHSLEHIIIDCNGIAESDICRELAVDKFSLNKYAKEFSEFVCARDVNAVQTICDGSYYFEVDI